MLDSPRDRAARPGSRRVPGRMSALPPFAVTRRRLLRWGTALPVVLLAACGGDPPATPTPTPELTSEEILARASRQLADTQTVAFALNVEGDTFIDPVGALRLLSATGHLQRPDRVATEFRASVAGRAITLQLITVGEQTWMTNVLTGDWEPAPPEFAYRPDVLFDNQQGLGPVMGRVEGVERLEDEDLDGRATFHLRAEVPDSVIGPLSYNTLKGSPITVDLWVAQDTGDLLRARLAEPPGEDRPNPAVWTLDLSGHGEQVTIEPPV